MRAVFSGTGIDINLGLEDKKKGEKDGKLECRIKGYKNPVLTLHIVDEVIGRDLLEEPGFHIKGTPKYGGPERRTKYEIYLSKENFEKLTNPKEDPIIKGGFFLSRCLYDRLAINYYAL